MYFDINVYFYEKIYVVEKLTPLFNSRPVKSNTHLNKTTFVP